MAPPLFLYSPFGECDAHLLHIGSGVESKLQSAGPKSGRRIRPSETADGGDEDDDETMPLADSRRSIVSAESVDQAQINMESSMTTVAVDTETTGLKPWHGDRPFMVTMQFENEQRVWSWPVDPLTREAQPRAKDVKEIRSVMEDPRVVKVFHNSVFDIRMLSMLGIETVGDVEDTLIASHVINSAEPHGLKYLANRYLDMPADEEKALHAQIVACRRAAVKQGWAISDAPQADYWLPDALKRAGISLPEKHPDPDLCSRYALGDVERTLALWFLYDEHLLDGENLRDVYDTEMEFRPIVYDSITRGVRMLNSRLKATSKMAQKEIQRLGKAFKFNLNSSKQLAKYLFEDLGLEPIKFGKLDRKTREPNPSTDKSVLNHYDDVPGVMSILEYRKAVKLGEYTDAYLRYRVFHDGDWNVHPGFNQVGATTGRMSSSGPSFQNVPTHGESLLIRARWPFLPRRGHVWLLMDYRQIEARIFAEDADEETMLKAFADNIDVYQMLADRLTSRLKRRGIVVERQYAKGIFLGRLYGLGEAKLARSLGCSSHDAELILEAFDAEYPRINQYMNEVMEAAERERVVYTRYGRRVPVWRDKEYTGVNYRTQGAAADLLKHQIIHTVNTLKRKRIPAHFLFPIHDESVFEIRREHATARNIQTIADCLEDNRGMFKRVATPVEIAVVETSWLEKIKFDSAEEASQRIMARS